MTDVDISSVCAHNDQLSLPVIQACVLEKLHESICYGLCGSVRTPLNQAKEVRSKLSVIGHRPNVNNLLLSFSDVLTLIKYQSKILGRLQLCFSFPAGLHYSCGSGEKYAALTFTTSPSIKGISSARKTGEECVWLYERQGEKYYRAFF